MGFIDRIETTISSKINNLLNRIEDPLETFDYSYEKQLELLQDVKRGVTEVTTSKKRLQLQRAKLMQDIEKLERQAKEAIAANRDDFARQALERKAAILQQVSGIDTQITDLEAQEQKLLEIEKSYPLRLKYSGQRRRL